MSLFGAALPPLQPPVPLRDGNGQRMEDAGGFLLPPHRTFGSLFNTVSRTYSYRWDEAVRHSQVNSLAMLRDSFVRGCLQERMLQLSELNWHLEPEDEKDARQKQVTADVQNVCKATHRWTQFTQQLAWATWFGRYGNQMDWQPGKVNGQTRLRVARHAPLNGDKIQFGWDGVPRVYVSHAWIQHYAPPGSHASRFIENMPEKDALLNATQEQPILYGERAPMLVLKDPAWRERFVIHQHECIDADFFDGEMAGGIHGVGIRSVIYWHYWVRGELLGWAINHLKKIGVGGILIFYYDEGNATAQTAAENAARDAGERYALAMPRPRGSSKDVNHAELLSFNEAGVTALTQVVNDYYERHMERYIIGQTLSSKPAGGGLGDGTATLHADTKYRILKFDANNLSDTLTDDLVRPAHKWNHPQDHDFRIRHVFDVPDPDAEAKISSAKTLFDMGMKLKANNLRGPAGQEKPEQDDETVSMAQMQQAQQDMQMQAQQQQAQTEATAQQGQMAQDQQAHQQQMDQLNQQAAAKVRQPDQSQPEEDGLPPLPASAAKLIQMQADAGMVEYAVQHAPHEISIQGKTFKGGQFIPSAVMANATPQEKAALDAGHQVNQAKQQRLAQQGLPPQAAPQAGMGQAPPQEETPFDRPEQVIPEEQMQDMLRDAAGRSDPRHVGPILQSVEKLARMSPSQFASNAGKAYQKAAQAQALGQITQDTYEAAAAKFISKYRFQQTKVISGKAQLPKVSKAAVVASREVGGAVRDISRPVLGHVIRDQTKADWWNTFGTSKVSDQTHKAVSKTAATILSRLLGRGIAHTPHAVHAAKAKARGHYQDDEVAVVYQAGTPHDEIRRALLVLLAEEGVEAEPEEVTAMLAELEGLVKDSCPRAQSGATAQVPWNLHRRWGRYQQALASRGDTATGHRRIAIPRGNLSDLDVGRLGFTGAEGSTLKTQGSFFLHEQPDHWILHQDAHPCLTRLLSQAIGVRKKVKALEELLTPFFGKGCPGLAHYLLSKVRKGSLSPQLGAKAKLRPKQSRQDLGGG